MSRCASTKRHKHAPIERLEARIVLSPLTWFAGPALPEPRGGAVAALGPDGSVLVLGGDSDTTVNSLAPTANAALGEWRATATPIGAPVSFAGLAPVSSQALLMYGGASGGGSGEALAASLHYDPGSADATQDAAEMLTPRQRLGFAADGMTPYAIGGSNGSHAALASVERFTPDASDPPSGGSWSAVAALPQALAGLSAISDGAGHLYTFGGQTAAGMASDAVYRYTVATNTWALAGAMPLAEHDGAAVLAPDGKVYVLGGIGTDGMPLSDVQVWDPSTGGTDGTWSLGTSLPAAISNEAATTDALGRINVIGGLDAAHQPVSSVFVSQQVGQPDAAPVFRSSPLGLPIVVGSTFTYAAAADGNPQPTYSLVSGPSGMTVDPVTGMVTYPTSAADLGAHPVDIRATNAAGQADQPFTVYIAPPPPTNVSAVGTSTTSIRLSWSPPPGVPVDHYVVYERFFIHSPRGSGGAYVYTVLADDVAGTSVVLGGLKPGTAHTYAVKAVAAGLASGYSGLAVGSTYPLIPGDLNGDGVVDAVDLGIVASHFGQQVGTAGLAAGDINHDGVVNVVDLGILATNFGASVVPVAPASPALADAPMMVPTDARRRPLREYPRPMLPMLGASGGATRGPLQVPAGAAAAGAHEQCA